MLGLLRQKCLLCLGTLLFCFINTSVAQVAVLGDRNTKPYRIVCYFGSWAGNRHGDGYLTPENLDAEACTHLIYAYATLRENQITSRDLFIDLEQDWGKGFYSKFNALRKRNSKLTTLVSIGEWQDGVKTETTKFSNMASNPVSRKTFVDSVVQFLKKYEFDGLDFVWEYPVFRGGGSHELDDKVNYHRLLEELKTAFKPHGFLLTVGVAARKDIVDVAYDIPQISKLADFINVMTFDFHGTWESRTGHNSPLYARPDETGENSFQNIDFAIRKWIAGGVDKKKVNLGMAMYGRCFRLENKAQHGYDVPASNAGIPGPFTQRPGMIGFNELCLNLKQKWTVVKNDYHYAPYAYHDDQWCSYDDEASVKEKTKYLKAMEIGGVMVWSLDTDDFKGLCYGRKFPLLSTIVAEMQDLKRPELPTTPAWVSQKPEITTLPVVTPSTEDPRLQDICKKEGLMKYPGECSLYIQCISESNVFRPIKQICPPNLVFNEKRFFCDFPSNVPECS